jgi:hypothetical protein
MPVESERATLFTDQKCCHSKFKMTGAIKMLDPFHFFYHPEPEPDEETEQRYRDLVLVVRDGIPVRKLTAIGIDPVPMIARMQADGMIGPDLKPLHPIDKNCWSELDALDGALIRLFAEIR